MRVLISQRGVVGDDRKTRTLEALRVIGPGALHASDPLVLIFQTACGTSDKVWEQNLRVDRDHILIRLRRDTADTTTRTDGVIHGERPIGGEYLHQIIGRRGVHILSEINLTRECRRRDLQHTCPEIGDLFRPSPLRGFLIIVDGDDLIDREVESRGRLAPSLSGDRLRLDPIHPSPPSPPPAASGMASHVFLEDDASYVG